MDFSGRVPRTTGPLRSVGLFHDCTRWWLIGSYVQVRVGDSYMQLSVLGDVQQQTLIMNSRLGMLLHQLLQCGPRLSFPVHVRTTLFTDPGEKRMVRERDGRHPGE